MMEKKDTEEESSWSGLENYSVIDDTNQYVKVGKKLVLNSIQISFEFLFQRASVSQFEEFKAQLSKVHELYNKDNGLVEDSEQEKDGFI